MPHALRQSVDITGSSLYVIILLIMYFKHWTDHTYLGEHVRNTYEKGRGNCPYIWSQTNMQILNHLAQRTEKTVWDLLYLNSVHFHSTLA